MRFHAPPHPRTSPLQARVKEQEAQKKLFTIKRAVCIGGGIVLVLVVMALLVSGSKRGANESGEGRGSKLALECG